MGFPTSEVCYTSATTRRETTKSKMDRWWHWRKRKRKKIRKCPNRPEHILVNIFNSCCDVNDADVVLTSLKNAWKQIFIFPLRYYANCVSTTLTAFITLKVSISFVVTLHSVFNGVCVNNS
jgi:hypothetical protein